MKISELPAIIRRKNALLFNAGLVSALALGMCVAFSFADERMVDGLNTWIKPIKFYASFVIFLWTFALILDLLPDRRKVKWISVGFVICMVMEAVPITIQAARGVPSHFNVSTAFDGVLFAIMGLFILANTVLAVYVLILFLTKRSNTSAVVRTAIQAGLILFILGAISGGMMVGLSNHSTAHTTTGGIPLFGWNPGAGDLRPAHFFTLHALQIIPLTVILFKSVLFRHAATVVVFSVLYALACVLLHVLALSA